MKEFSILHVIPSLGTGGAERMLSALVTAKRAEPAKSIVVDMIGDGDLAYSVRASGTEVIDLGLKHPSGLPTALLKLTQIIKRTRPAVIQSWLYYADLLSLFALSLSGRRSLTRLYWGVRCSDMDQSQYSALLRWSINTCAKLSGSPDAVVANSFAGRTYHLGLGYTPRAFPVILNGIQTNLFRPDPDQRREVRRQLDISDEERVAIHVARVDPMKNHGALIEVARALPQVKFICIGAGTEKLAGPDNLRALGKRGDVANYYLAADLAISTSAFGEGFSNVIAEAMSSGLPVVATDVGDAARIIGDTGIVVRRRSLPEMIDAVGRLSAEPDTQKAARAASCRNRIETYFSLAQAVAAFDALHFSGRILPDVQ